MTEPAPRPPPAGSAAPAKKPRRLGCLLVALTGLAAVAFLPESTCAPFRQEYAHLVGAPLSKLSGHFSRAHRCIPEHALIEHARRSVGKDGPYLELVARVASAQVAEVERCMQHDAGGERLDARGVAIITTRRGKTVAVDCAGLRSVRVGHGMRLFVCDNGTVGTVGTP